MNSSSTVKWQAIGILSLTLIVGALLGGALVGYFVKNRIAAWAEFSTPEGYTRQVLSVIGPVTDEQAEVIVPLLNAQGTEISSRLTQIKRDLLHLGEQSYLDLLPTSRQNSRSELPAHVRQPGHGLEGWLAPIHNRALYNWYQHTNTYKEDKRYAAS